MNSWVENPFHETGSKSGRPAATAVVIFGATGDLTHRKLIPALYNLACDGYLPPDCVVIGCSRSPLSDDQFREEMRKSVATHSRRGLNDEQWSAFAGNLFYLSLNAMVEADFEKLKGKLDQLGNERSERFNYLFYLATSPDFFGPIARNLHAAGLVEPFSQGGRQTSLVVEKPFGVDLESARELNQVLRRSFDEQQIYRIDHYLAKETVQNILVFRFANGIFEPVWNRNFVDQIQISVCEDIGVGTRAGYFDRTGILRDIVQNHLLQMLSLLCIEPPNSLNDADSIRDEKVKVLRAVRRFSPEMVFSETVRAQYSMGSLYGEDVAGYLAEKGVAADSRTETFCALRLEIDNWRWSGVPIYIRAGKRLPKRITELTIFFKRPPTRVFGAWGSAIEQNVLAIQVQPNEGIGLKFLSKPPGHRMRVRPVVMDFTYGNSFGVPSADAYERLILDAMRGDPTLFTRDDEIEEAWSLLKPVLDVWASRENSPPMYEYRSGTWGPAAAAGLLRPAGHRWRRL